jgi:hypothetical protein
MSLIQNNNFHNTQYHRKNDLSVDFKYICIKKEFFDTNMIYLNYSNLKRNKYIEIIYKSPSIYLEGLFFKTPPISLNAISIFHKDKQPNNITIKIALDMLLYEQFIKILKNIDEYISAYIVRFSKEIENELKTHYNDYRALMTFRYEQIIKFKSFDIIEMHLKSYLDKHIINELENKTNKNNNMKYIFTFNISSIYFGNSSLIPLVKCNRCEYNE